jgi:predicted RNA-binding Zn-ribbon protein involved in translation (DUF1610 family)
MWIEQKYIALLSSSVRNFKKKQNNVWEMSCPICGDSTTNRRRARGYIYLRGQKYKYACHNCGAGMHFGTFLEHVNPILYREYRFERFRDRQEQEAQDIAVAEEVEAKEAFFSLQTNAIDRLATKVSRLDERHEAYRYLKSRKIPFIWFDRLFYTEDMKSIASLFPGRYDDTKFGNEPRIVIPIYNRQKELVGVTARAIKPSPLRYIMLRKSDDEPLIFNLERINVGQTVYTFEGAIDSMFMDNAIAVSGADFSKVSQIIPKEQTVIIFDNQPRNKELIKRIDKTADAGFPMFVWPSNRALKKDFNANIQDGIIAPEKVKKFIDDNTFRGMTLKLKLTDWKKLEVANGNFSTSHRR